MTTIAELKALLSLDDTAYTRGLAGAVTSTKTSAAAIARDTQAMRQGFGLVTGAVGAFASALAVRQLAQFTGAALDNADALGKQAARVGVSARALQDYRLAGQLAGVQTAEMDRAVATFVTRLGQLRSGQGSLKGPLEQMTDGLGKQLVATKSSGAALDLYLREIARIPDAAGRAALASAAFGEELGPKLALLVAGGADAVSGLRAQFGDLLSIQDDLTVKAAEVNDRFTLLGQAFRAGFDTGVLTTFGDSVDANREKLEQLNRVGQRFGEVVGGAFEFSVEKADDFIKIVDNLIDSYDRMQARLDRLAQGNVLPVAPGDRPDFSGLRDSLPAPFRGRLAPRDFAPEEAVGALGLPDVLRPPRDVLSPATLESMRSQLAIYRETVAEQGKLTEGARKHVAAVSDATLAEANRLADARAELAVRGELTRSGQIEAKVAAYRVDLQRRQVAQADSLAGLYRDQLQAESALADATARRDLEGQLRLAEAELAVAGESEATRQEILAVLAKENELRARGVDLASEQAQAELAMASAIVRTRAELARQQAVNQQLVADLERGFDRIGEAVTQAFVTDDVVNWRGVALAAISEVAQSLIRLSVINPLKNALLGTDSPTLGGEGGGGLVGGLVQNIGQSLIGDFVKEQIGLPSLADIGSALGIGGAAAGSAGFTAAGGAVLGAETAIAGSAGVAASTAAASAAAPLAALAPVAIPLAAVAALYVGSQLLGGDPEVPNAGARVGQLGDGRLAVTASGADNGGDAGPLRQAAQALAVGVNELVAITGASLDVSGRSGLSLAVRSFDGQVTRGPDDVLRDLVQTGALAGLPANVQAAAESEGLDAALALARGFTASILEANDFADTFGEVAAALRDAGAQARRSADDWRRLGDSLTAGVQSLRVSDLSPLSLGARVAEADAAFARAATAGLAGDLEAAGQAFGLFQTALQLGQQFDASGVAQANRFNAGTTTLEQLAQVTGVQAGQLDQQAVFADQGLDYLGSIDDALQAQRVNTDLLRSQAGQLDAIETALGGGGDVAQAIASLTTVMRRVANQLEAA